MREAARAAAEIADGLTPERLLESRRDQLALSKALEWIGEAASKLSVEFRGAHPEVPWDAIIGMRHRLVHDYPRTDFTRLLDTVHQHIPGLLRHLDPLIPPLPREDSQ